MPTQTPLADTDLITDTYFGSDAENTNVGSDDSLLPTAFVDITVPPDPPEFPFHPIFITRSVYRFEMPPANAINMVLRRHLEFASYEAEHSGLYGSGYIRLVNDHVPATAFVEGEATWNVPASGENWGAVVATGGGDLEAPATTYDLVTRADDTWPDTLEDSVQAQFEAALARGDAYFTLIEAFEDAEALTVEPEEGFGPNVTFEYSSKDHATEAQRPLLVYDLALTGYFDNKGLDSVGQLRGGLVC